MNCHVDVVWEWRARDLFASKVNYIIQHGASEYNYCMYVWCFLAFRFLSHRMRFWKLGRRIEVCNLSGTRCILRSLSQCQFPWAPSFLNRYWRRWSTRLIPLRDFGGASGFHVHRSHLCPRLEATFPVAIPESAEVHCSMLQCYATKWYLIHLLSLIWIFHEYKYSESYGGTQTQQKCFFSQMELLPKMKSPGRY